MITATVATVVAADALLQAQVAHTAACQALLPTYNAQTATVTQAHTYADCITLLYPESIAGPDAALLKAFIFLALVGSLLGAYFFDEGCQKGFIDYFMAACLGAIALPFFGLTLVAAYYGVKFLFS